jgi:hypothetical protein
MPIACEGNRVSCSEGSGLISLPPLLLSDEVTPAAPVLLPILPSRRRSLLLPALLLGLAVLFGASSALVVWLLAHPPRVPRAARPVRGGEARSAEGPPPVTKVVAKPPTAARRPAIARPAPKLAASTVTDAPRPRVAHRRARRPKAAPVVPQRPTRAAPVAPAAPASDDPLMRLIDRAIQKQPPAGS